MKLNLLESEEDDPIAANPTVNAAPARDHLAALARALIGTVVEVNNAVALVAIDDREPIPVALAADDAALQQGHLIELTILGYDSGTQRPILSRTLAQRTHAWQRIAASIGANPPAIYEACFSGMRGSGKSKRAIVEIETLEAELVSTENIGPSTKSREKFYVVPVTANPTTGVIQVSREAASWIGLSQNLPGAGGFQAGDVVAGKVKSIVDYGAFVTLTTPYGDFDSLLHNTRLSYGRRAKAAELLSVGDDIDVVIHKVDIRRKWIHVSRLEFEEDPFVRIAAQYSVGDRISVVCRDRVDYGVFVEIENDYEALAHISGLCEATTDQRYNDGKILEAFITTIDPERRRISVAEIPPLVLLKERHPINAIVRGRVVEILGSGTEQNEDFLFDGESYNLEIFGDEIDDYMERNEDLTATAVVALANDDRRALAQALDPRVLTTPWNEQNWRVIGFDEAEELVLLGVVE